MQCKVVMLGESGVGKSSILNQFINNSFLRGKEQPTVSPHFVRRTQTIYKLGSHKVQYNLWDTAGQEKYRCLTSMYFRDANVAIIVFDVTSSKSLSQVDYWAEELNKSNAFDFVMVLVGNKCDLESKRQISRAEGLKKADEIGAEFYFEASASETSNIQNLFQEIGVSLYKRREEEELIPDVSPLYIRSDLIYRKS